MTNNINSNTLNKINIKDLNYNSNFLCTYRIINNFKEVENDDELSLQCYQVQLLQAFNMKKFEDYILQKKIEQLHLFLRDNEEIKELMTILSDKNSNIAFLNGLSKDLETTYIFQLLFSYDYFDIFHKCLSKYLNFTKNKSGDLRDNEFFIELKEFIQKS